LARNDGLADTARVVIRAISAIVAALEFVAPKFRHTEEASAHLQALAVEYELDPFTIIAVVRNESAWQSGAINRRSGARGLGQIMPSNYRQCQDAPEGRECQRIKADLLGWKYNLKETARTMATWRGYCGKKVGSELAIHWLPGYQGLDIRRGAICGHQKRQASWVSHKAVPKLTQKVLSKRRELETRFAKRARGNPSAPAPISAQASVRAGRKAKTLATPSKGRPRGPAPTRVRQAATATKSGKSSVPGRGPSHFD
jgi:hypothetical protein